MDMPPDSLPPHAKSSFVSDGIACAGTLYRPAGDPALPRPAILLVLGWGGTQEVILDAYVRRFTAAGLAVMTFDFRCWGDSAGTPRQVIRMAERERDIEAALAHLKAQPGIDAGRIVLWGSSLGGGHVVRLAPRHPELAAAIAMVPMLDGQAAVRAVPPLLSMRFVALGLVDLLRGGNPIYLATVGAPGAFASMTRDGAHTVTPRIEEASGKPYDNRVAARSMLGMATYRPFKRLRDIGIPTLIIGATRDTVTPFEAGRIAAAGNPRITVAMIDADHFEPYFEPGFAAAVAPQIDFLERLGLASGG